MEAVSGVDNAVRQKVQELASRLSDAIHEEAEAKALLTADSGNPDKLAFFKQKSSIAKDLQVQYDDAADLLARVQQMSLAVQQMVTNNDSATLPAVLNSTPVIQSEAQQGHSSSHQSDTAALHIRL